MSLKSKQTVTLTGTHGMFDALPISASCAQAHQYHARRRISALDKTPPEILAMSPEEKRDFEKKLVRRIDLTVLPSE